MKPGAYAGIMEKFSFKIFLIFWENNFSLLAFFSIENSLFKNIFGQNFLSFVRVT